jgi:threonylcarbamoyladenosine tRNA methylthiotransferase MtaB
MADGCHSLMPYLHVPLQSGCDSVLRRMKRKYELKEMYDFLIGRKM